MMRQLQFSALGKYCKVLEETPECFVGLAFQSVMFQSSAESALSGIGTYSVKQLGLTINCERCMHDINFNQ